MIFFLFCSTLANVQNIELTLFEMTFLFLNYSMCVQVCNKDADVKHILLPRTFVYCLLFLHISSNREGFIKRTEVNVCPLRGKQSACARPHQTRSSPSDLQPSINHLDLSTLKCVSLTPSSYHVPFRPTSYSLW